MHGQQTYAKLAGFADCCSNRIWNIVVLQIEKHAPSRGYEFADDRRPLSRIQLHSHFVEADRITERGNNFLSLRRGGNVQRDDELLTGGHEFSLA